MGIQVYLIIALVLIALYILGWTTLLKIQRERKIADLKIKYLRVNSEEQSGYAKYLLAEKNLQTVEMELQKIGESITALHNEMKNKRHKCRAMIMNLRDLKMGLTPDEDDEESSNQDSVLGESDVPQMDYLDIEVKTVKTTSELRNIWTLLNVDRHRIISEKRKRKNRQDELPILTDEVDTAYDSWNMLNKEIEKIELDFRSLDKEAYKKFIESQVKRSKEKDTADPERELVNLILLLSNKKGILYARKKEAAKDPTTSSSDQIKKCEEEIRKLESQITLKSKKNMIPAERVTELKKMFVK